MDEIDLGQTVTDQERDAVRSHPATGGGRCRGLKTEDQSKTVSHFQIIKNIILLQIHSGHESKM